MCHPELQARPVQSQQKVNNFDFYIFRSYQLKTGKMLPFTESIRPLVPLTLCLVIGSIWTTQSPTNIVERYPRCVYFMTGTLFSNICVSFIRICLRFIVQFIVDFFSSVCFQCRLIVSQMSNTRCDIFHWLLVPMFVATFFSLCLQNTAKLTEAIILYLLMTIVFMSHLHYGACVVSYQKLIFQKNLMI